MELSRLFSRTIFDLRVIVGLCGVVLSVVMHELFHIIVHWGEIDSIHIFPDTQAIAEVIFTPSAEYDLAFEEGAAYLITMVTIILTAMLISDIHDAREHSAAYHKILSRDFLSSYPGADKKEALNHLAAILTAKN